MLVWLPARSLGDAGAGGNPCAWLRARLGADVLPEQFERPQGMYILAALRDATEAQRVFDALADGGSVRMPLQKTFWSPSFGVVVDRFGTPWEITVE